MLGMCVEPAALGAPRVARTLGRAGDSWQARVIPTLGGADAGAASPPWSSSRARVAAFLRAELVVVAGGGCRPPWQVGTMAKCVAECSRGSGKGAADAAG